MNPSYASQVLRLTLLVPEIVEAILEGRDSVEMTLAMKPFPVTWTRLLIPGRVSVGCPAGRRRAALGRRLVY